jgi:trehalose/maltose hydrolase-like predicted phosphorylase
LKKVWGKNSKLVDKQKEASSMIFLRYLVLLYLISLLFCVAPPEWQNRIDQAQMLYSDTEPQETLQTYVGNGYMATQINSQNIFISGVYNGPADAEYEPSHRARTPSFVNWQVQNSRVIASAIDIEKGVYYRRVQTNDVTSQSTVEQRWYAHRKYKNLIVHTTQIITPSTIPVCLIHSIGPQSVDISYAPSTSTPQTLSQLGSTTIREISTSPLVSVAAVYPNGPYNTSYCLPLNQTMFFYPVVLVTDLEGKEDLVAKATKLWEQLTALGEQQLLKEHIDEWASIWEAGLEVGGDIDLARALNSSQYYILSSIRSGWDYSLSPGSLSSDAYHGHVFWDCETWMYPQLLMQHPDLARSIINYRYNLIPEARNKAKSYTPPYNGIMFPWESAFSGAETCPTVAATGLYEIHISGDIVFSIQQYHDVTELSIEDKKRYFELVKGVGDFWMSKVTRRGKTDLWDINNIIPPDEYAEHVNNSVYTNVVASMSLQFAQRLGSSIGTPVPSDWLNVASNLYLPRNGSLNLEYEGYKAGTIIKQADVVMLAYPLQWPDMTPESRKADLIYYENVTDYHGPAMTWGMHAVGWLELQNDHDTDKSHSLFKRSYANAQKPFYVWTETPTGGAINFITGAGGFLQTYLFGYGGLRIHPDHLAFNPIPVLGTTITRFRAIKYKNTTFTLEYNNNNMVIRSQAGSFFVTTAGNSYHVRPGNSVTLSRSVFRISITAPSPSSRALWVVFGCLAAVFLIALIVIMAIFFIKRKQNIYQEFR